MPSVHNFVFCLNNSNSNGTNNINGVLCAIAPEYVPGLFSFGVNFSILDLTEGEHNLSMEFKDSTGIEVASIKDTTVNYAKDASSNLPVEYLGVNVAANFQNVDFKSSGLYSMDIIFDGASLGRFEIFVKGKNERA